MYLNSTPDYTHDPLVTCGDYWPPLKYVASSPVSNTLITMLITNSFPNPNPIPNHITDPNLDKTSSL